MSVFLMIYLSEYRHMSHGFDTLQSVYQWFPTDNCLGTLKDFFKCREQNTDYINDSLCYLNLSYVSVTITGLTQPKHIGR